MSEKTVSRDREYIEALERRIEVLTQGLRDAVEIIEGTGLDSMTQRDALNKSDDIDAVFRWTCFEDRPEDYVFNPKVHKAEFVPPRPLSYWEGFFKKEDKK